MKLAIFGGVVAAAGLALGIDGLILSGGFWVVTGLLIAWTLAARRREVESTNLGSTFQNEGQAGRIERLGVPKDPGSWWVFVMTLVIGLGSLAIGILEVGFSGNDESLRWLPFAVGVLFTGLAAISLPVRLGMIDPDAAAAVDLSPATVTSPTSNGEGADPKARLEHLEELRRSDLISPEEYEAQRQRILGSI